MRRKQIRSLGYFLAILLIASTLAMGACSPKPKLSSIAITPTQPSNLHAGSTQQFKATGTYSDKSTSDITSSVTWKSSNNTAATISSSGLARGLAPGNTDITAALSNISSTAVTLPVVQLLSIAIRQTSTFNLTVNSTQQFTATGTYSDGTEEDVTLTGTWSSSVPTVAAITKIGLATGNSAGNTNITVSELGVTSPALILAVSPPDTGPKVSAIAISRSVVANLPVGSTQQLKATAIYTSGTTVEVTGQAIWISSDSSVATVSSSGLATGKGAGKCQITAFYSGATSPALTITVTAP